MRQLTSQHMLKSPADSDSPPGHGLPIYWPSRPKRTPTKLCRIRTSKSLDLNSPQNQHLQKNQWVPFKSASITHGPPRFPPPAGKTTTRPPVPPVRPQPKPPSADQAPTHAQSKPT